MRRFLVTFPGLLLKHTVLLHAVGSWRRGITAERVGVRDGRREMFGHERLGARIVVVHEDHRVIAEGLGGEDLAQRHQVRLLHLAPHLHHRHALSARNAVS